MTTERLLQRVDQLIEMGNAVLRTRRPINRTQEFVDSAMITGFRAASLSFIERAFGGEHPHFREFSENTKSHFPGDAERGLAILKVIRGEIAGGWLFTVKGLVTAEVFTDFIEMAEYLLDSGYKDPAAVIAGSTLEEHLRQLCMKTGISITRQKDGKDVALKADALNNELAKAGVYTALDQKNVTAWLGLRNNAAHGKYTEYNDQQVKTMMAGVIEFMARVSI